MGQHGEVGGSTRPASSNPQWQSDVQRKQLKIKGALWLAFVRRAFPAPLQTTGKRFATAQLKRTSHLLEQREAEPPAPHAEELEKERAKTKRLYAEIARLEAEGPASGDPGRMSSGSSSAAQGIPLHQPVRTVGNEWFHTKTCFSH